ncbi:hypothetical protein OCS_05561 [Ophiocordyceps sinensis CO18]|uniref:Uncharacterized protein n=1 Tax=Ophiocordyceps sinensis (strain Co18 / CGMCC 3.14243) TaxID=911162 RepID=T5AAG6_OPHSC|nr:hypothetical protein OCS_05561 [Ophiocordyceps sinensis CO18]
MVRFTLTLLALGVSALAATTHNGRDIEARAVPEMLGRAVPAMALNRRDDNNNQNKKEDSEKMKTLKKERDGIDEKLTSARTEAKKAGEAVRKAFKEMPQEKQDQFKGKQQEIGVERQNERASAQPSAQPSVQAQPSATPAPAT